MITTAAARELALRECVPGDPRREMIAALPERMEAEVFDTMLPILLKILRARPQERER